MYVCMAYDLFQLGVLLQQMEPSHIHTKEDNSGYKFLRKLMTIFQLEDEKEEQRK